MTSDEAKRNLWLIEARDKFRKDNPTLKLPPAREYTPEEIRAMEQEVVRQETTRLQKEKIAEKAKTNTPFAVKSIRRLYGKDKDSG